MPSLSFEILRVVTGTPTLLVRTDKTGIRRVGVRAWRSRPTRTASCGCIIAGQDPSIYVRPPTCSTTWCRGGELAGKLVLIGTSAVGLNDIKTTPVSSTMPGVEIHAQVLESVLSGA